MIGWVAIGISVVSIIISLWANIYINRAYKKVEDYYRDQM